MSGKTKDWLESYASAPWAQRRTSVSNSLSVSMRTGAQELTMAVRFLNEKGYYPKTRSEIAGMCVAVLASQFPEEEWVGVEEAHSFLDTHFGIATQVRGKRVRSSRIAQVDVRKKAYQPFAEQASSEPLPEPKLIERGDERVIVLPTSQDVARFTEEKADYLKELNATAMSEAMAQAIGLL